MDQTTNRLIEKITDWWITSCSPALVSAVATLTLELKTWLLVLRFSLNYWNLIKTHPNPVHGSSDYHELMETLLLLTQHKHVHMSTNACHVLKRNVASGGDEWTDRYLLCCVVLCWSHCAVEFLLCESGERAGPPHLDSWTLSLCDPSQMIIPAAASQSSFNIELMLSVSHSRKLLTWHISCQGVQTCDLSVMCVSVQPLPNNTTLPVRIRMSQKWDKLDIKLYRTLKK